MESMNEIRLFQIASEYLAKYVPKDAKILDVGAGTGLAGKALNNLGYKHLTAMDMSSKMLEDAQKKEVYSEFYLMTLGEPLDIPDNLFDAIISVGVFTEGHAHPKSFDELIRVTKQGGFIIYTLRSDIYENNGFKQKQSFLEFENKWMLIEVSEKIQMLSKEKSVIFYQVWVYKVVK